jgi:hypothetical protein
MTMFDRQAFQLVTLVVPHALEASVARDLGRLGASGWTVTDTRGSPRASGDREGWSTGVRFEAVVPPVVAEAILQHAAETWFPEHAAVAWVSAVAVARPAKFAGG